MVSIELKWTTTAFYIFTHSEHDRYSVIPKTKKCLEDIDKFIKENHFDECGIIYCLSRMDCEKVAEKLQVGFPFSVFIVLQRFIICKSIGKIFIS